MSPVFLDRDKTLSDASQEATEIVLKQLEPTQNSEPGY